MKLASTIALAVGLAAVASPALAIPIIPSVQYTRGPLTLPTRIFAGPALGDGDQDQDFLIDAYEDQLAEHFKPYFVFDSAESATRIYEPITLFQVRPNGCVGVGCAELKIIIKYVFLWALDGGYGPSSGGFCDDTHVGDNQGITVNLTSTDGGRTWFLPEGRRAVAIGDEGHWLTFVPGRFTPVSSLPEGFPMLWTDSGGIYFPYVFFSASKHHQYSGPWNDGEDSIYSDWWCNDDVNGNGRNFWACLNRDCTSEGLPFNNVGEPEAHPESRFVGSLSQWYPGEHAWSTARFRGGYGGSSDATSSLNGMWSRATFTLSDDFWDLYTAEISNAW
ncbi:MAG: hypothetical protein KC933_29655 [Myxococcales bacterium]|nr:hypothetical protein [Myxococcales bacterium]MCB9651077.1 hypothetical protein [Deltaproteobacteria bacterium]